MTKQGLPSLPWATKAGWPAAEHQHQQKDTSFCLHLTDAAHSLMHSPPQSFYFWLLPYLNQHKLLWKAFLFLSSLSVLSEIKCVPPALQLSAHTTQKSKVPLMSTYVNPLLSPFHFVKSSLQMYTKSPSSPELYGSTWQNLSGQVSRARWAPSFGAPESGVWGSYCPPEGVPVDARGVPRAAPFDSSTRRVCWWPRGHQGDLNYILL